MQQFMSKQSKGQTGAGSTCLGSLNRDGGPAPHADGIICVAASTVAGAGLHGPGSSDRGQETVRRVRAVLSKFREEEDAPELDAAELASATNQKSCLFIIVLIVS